jgi:hypothetical protein
VNLLQFWEVSHMDAVALPDECIDWAKLRGRYKATSHGVYLNAGSRGLMSDTARAAGETHLRSDCESPGSNPARTQQLAEARDTFAHLIHAESGTVALTKNVSEGLNIIATAVDWQPGDNSSAPTSNMPTTFTCGWLSRERASTCATYRRVTESSMPRPWRQLSTAAPGW